MNEINFQEEKQSDDFQIVLLDRDKFGKPTGKKVYYSSNDGADIADFYQKHVDTMKAKMGKRKRRRQQPNKKK